MAMEVEYLQTIEDLAAFSVNCHEHQPWWRRHAEWWVYWPVFAVADMVVLIWYPTLIGPDLPPGTRPS
jgi:hypothetical protein